MQVILCTQLKQSTYKMHVKNLKFFIGKWRGTIVSQLCSQVKLSQPLGHSFKQVLRCGPQKCGPGLLNTDKLKVSLRNASHHSSLRYALFRPSISPNSHGLDHLCWVLLHALRCSRALGAVFATVEREPSRFPLFLSSGCHSHV